MTSKATEAEANKVETATVEWRDLKFDIPIDREEWSFDAILAFEEGKAFVALRELLPAKQFAEFRAQNPKGKDAATLLDAVASALGFKDAGE